MSPVLSTVPGPELSVQVCWISLNWRKLSESKAADRLGLVRHGRDPAEHFLSLEVGKPDTTWQAREGQTGQPSRLLLALRFLTLGSKR